MPAWPEQALCSVPSTRVRELISGHREESVRRAPGVRPPFFGAALWIGFWLLLLHISFYSTRHARRSFHLALADFTSFRSHCARNVNRIHSRCLDFPFHENASTLTLCLPHSVSPSPFLISKIESNEHPFSSEQWNEPGNKYRGA